MTGYGTIIHVNGFGWKSVTNETVAGPVYSWRQVQAAGGDPKRIEGQTNCSDDRQGY